LSVPWPDDAGIPKAELNPADYHYWDDNGWFDRVRRYYIDIRVNPVYLAVGQNAEVFGASAGAKVQD
jgi:hypothetical protein